MTLNTETSNSEAACRTGIETFTIEEVGHRERLDAYLHSRYSDISRGSIQRMLESGGIKVNGVAVKAAHRPKTGDSIQIQWPEPKPDRALPEEIPLDILFEDDDLLVINKPPGLVIHPSAGHEAHTLVNALLHHCEGELSGIGGVVRPGIVHRLDKDTSGCLVSAKNDATHLALSGQFQQRGIEKVYHAIACGELPKASGEVLGAIGRHPIHRKRMAITPNGQGREARSAYRVLERLKSATLVEVQIFTGRTHQIRVHLQHLGCPVAGDDVYGERANRRLTELTGYAPPRQMLHAFSLAFQHPRTGERMKFEAPWPEDFKNARQTLAAAG